MFLEVIGLTADDVQAAQTSGASRIELVSAMDQDGLSPTIAVLESVLAIAIIPVRVMVRFHNDGFVYSAVEVEKMAEWIAAVDHLPIEGFVIGGLTVDGAIDCGLIERLAKVTKKPFTFHRAIDRCDDLLAAINVLNGYDQIDCILTSGGIERPLHENIAMLQMMQVNTGKRILVGGGVDELAVTQLLAAGLNAIHIGSLARVDKKMSAPIDTNHIAQLVEMKVV